MSIKADVKELEILRSEIKMLKLRIKTLRYKEKAAEKRISDFLKSREQPGLKFQGTAIILEEKTKSLPKKPKDKDSDTILVLERLGVQNPQEALKEIIAARKGDSVHSEKLKVQKYKGQ
jgi:hypothetical protein